MLTIDQKTRLMALLRDPDNKDLLDVVMGMDTLKPKQERTPRQRVNDIHKMWNVRPDKWVEAKLREIIADANEPQHEPETVINVVHQVHGITTEALKGPDQKRPVCDARHLVLGLMESHCLWYSMSDLAKLFNRTPTTAQKSVGVFHTLTETDPIFRAKREKCEALLRERN